ncbi:hypothetical protein RIF29_25901 [Crotalaria pallida]|uniref:Protein transport protein Sec61 subunit beta n=1 Tax=Crotalaria pallida TaxID=3830 RepID=A0AAN9HXT0_CROPI
MSSERVIFHYDIWDEERGAAFKPHERRENLFLQVLLYFRSPTPTHLALFFFQKMALGGTAPPRGSAAAAASLRRRRTTSGGASGGAAGTMLQFYTDDAPGLKISPNVVLVMSIGFIAFVAILHVMGKLYFVRKD